MKTSPDKVPVVTAKSTLCSAKSSLVTTECPVKKYAQDIVTGRIDACKFIKQACQRHLNDLERQGTEDFPFIYDTEKANRFFRFCSHLTHYKGAYAGKKLVLLPWQLFILGNVYGWVHKDNGTWRFRQVYLEIPRKQGKTFLAGAVALYDVGLMEKTGAEVYIAATKQEQAMLCYKDVKAFIRGNREIKRHFKIFEGKHSIQPIKSYGTSFIKPLGADSERLDGLNPITAIFDECHAYKNRHIIDVIQGAFGARTNYHSIFITTAGSNRTGPCYEQRTQLTKILEGTFVNERTFGVIYTLDEGEEKDFDNKRLWKKANPSLGEGKEFESMEKECIDAKQIPSKLNEFLTKQLCIWVDSTSSWLDVNDWNACTIKTPLNLKGKKCIIGLDLATVNDLSAVTLFFPKQEGLEKPYTQTICYLPADTVAEKEHHAQVPYSSWIRSGHLKTTPGAITDFDVIKEDIMNLAKLYKVEVSYDKFFSNVLIAGLIKEGVTCTPYPQNFVGMNTPTLELERMIISKGIQIEDNPLFAWQASNVVLARDTSGNVKPNKEAYRNKIDAVVALIMAIGRNIVAGGKVERKTDPNVTINTKW